MTPLILPILLGLRAHEESDYWSSLWYKSRKIIVSQLSLQQYESRNGGI